MPQIPENHLLQISVNQPENGLHYNYITTGNNVLVIKEPLANYLYLDELINVIGSRAENIKLVANSIQLTYGMHKHIRNLHHITQLFLHKMIYHQKFRIIKKNKTTKEIKIA